jgi:glycogen debranching enzyme
MPFKVQVGPPQISIHQGQTVLITDPDGQIASPSERGLYFLDTRLISSWAVEANGEPWELLNGGPITYYAQRIFLTNRLFLTEDGPIAPRTIGFTIGRSISGGMHEDLDISNNGMKPIRFQLEVILRCDFADVFEVKSNRIVRRGRIVTEWSQDTQQLRTAYSYRDFHRAVTITAVKASQEAVYANGRLSFEVALQPGEAWHTCLHYTLEDGTQQYLPTDNCIADCESSHHADTMAAWLDSVTKIQTTNEEFYRLYRQALEDMAALRLPIAGTDHMVFLPAAGLPWFVAPFGRDSLIVSLQNMLIYPEFAQGALDVLGSLQAKEDDPYRDAEPGKILHELRHGELAHFGERPHSPYFGSADATPLFLVVLEEYERWTGDVETVRTLEGPARAAVEWMERYGDQDGDGYIEYQTRNPKTGLENQCWKDSGNSIVYPDGRLASLPRATCEIQGYAYDARVRTARLAREVWGDIEYANRLDSDAAKLKDAFNRDFWLSDVDFYALALDGEKKPVPTLTSNVGHLLWSGIVADDRVESIVDHLADERMFSGWGIRTMADGQPAYNPIEYHNGTVWPHDTALIAAGLHRYGRRKDANRLIVALMEAASHFAYRLPEAFAGYARSETRLPVPYPTACSPQAWAAAAPLLLMRLMLGLDPTTTGLTVRPHLPADVNRVVVRGLPGRWGRSDAVAVREAM